MSNSPLASTLPPDVVVRAPKVLLHDHLDGGMRPTTIVELAAEQGYQKLPTTDVAELTTWFHRGAARHSLGLYLETFEHTIAVIQEHDALVRVASEAVQDLAADGVVYAEIRYAPELCVNKGLSLDRVVEAVQEGIAAGTQIAAAAGMPISVGTLLCAMRQAAHSYEIAELAIRHRDEGVVGFDIAGPEDGFPPSRHLAAFNLVHEANFHTTIHAGEAFGLPSIHEALQYCGAERLGHGVRIVDDIKMGADGSAELGRLASFVRDTQRSPRDVPDLQRAHGRRAIHGGASDRSAQAAALPGHGQHRQPADERLLDVVGVHGTPGGLRVRPRRLPVVHDQRHEERLLALRGPAATHQRRDQAPLRRAALPRSRRRPSDAASTV